MAKLTLGTVANLLGNPTSAANTLNNNSALTEAALENTLSRNGATPNQMNADIDMNGNDLLNVGSIDATNFSFEGIDFEQLIDQALVASDQAEASAALAAGSVLQAQTAVTQAQAAQAAAETAAGSITPVNDQIHGAASKPSLADADELVLSDSAASWVLKKFTLPNLITSIFKTTRTIPNAQFSSPTFKLFNSSGTPRALTFNNTAFTADRSLSIPDRDVDLATFAVAGSSGPQSLTGTTFDVTGIPPTAKVVSLTFTNVTTSAASQPNILLGTASAFATTGYVSYVSGQTAAATSAGGTAAFIPLSYAAVNGGPFWGIVELRKIGNSWAVSGSMTTGGTAITNIAAGVTLSDALTRVRIGTAAGTTTLSGQIQLDWI